MRSHQESPSGRAAKIAIVIVVVVAAVIGTRFFFGAGPTGGRDNWPSRFSSNGERIYFTATSASGSPITGGGGGMHMRMSGGGCVACHGADRQGGRAMPQFWQVVPALTPAALFGQHDDGAADDGHGDHERYTDETLGRAITEGIDPAGKPLASAMPRWSMSPGDLADLVAYLKTPARR